MTKEEKQQNLEKRRIQRKQWQLNNPEKYKASQKLYDKKHRIKKLTKNVERYGITWEDYKKMWIEQKGSCAICGKYQLELRKRLAVDHNHTTDEVRGLLCSNCNLVLGMFEDDTERLKNAIVYLNKYQK